MVKYFCIWKLMVAIKECRRRLNAFDKHSIELWLTSMKID